MRLSLSGVYSIYVIIALFRKKQLHAYMYVCMLDCLDIEALQQHALIKLLQRCGCLGCKFHWGNDTAKLRRNKLRAIHTHCIRLYNNNIVEKEEKKIYVFSADLIFHTNNVKLTVELTVKMCRVYCVYETLESAAWLVAVDVSALGSLFVSLSLSCFLPPSVGRHIGCACVRRSCCLICISFVSILYGNQF